jgi:uncharacterized membrane protein YkoI
VRLNPKGLFIVIAILCVAPLAFAAERKITKSDLPPAVRNTAEQQSVGSTVTGYSKDIEGGKLEYEVQMTTNGHAKDVTIAPDGQLIEIEEQVLMSDLPAGVRTALQTMAGKGKITQVESLAKHGAIVAYEAQVLTAGKHTEVQVGPDGKTLNHEE